MRWVIGDIHGMLRPLEALLAAVGRVDPDPLLIFVGDYVNRGPDSRGVIDLLLQLPNARFARGNHDDVFDLVLHDQAWARDHAGGDRRLAFQWFMQHGLDATLRSYGADDEALERLAQRPHAAGIDRVCAVVPEAHRRFIRALPPVLEFDDLFVAHAKWDPADGTDAPRILDRLAENPALAHNLIWGRFTDDELMLPKAWQRPGYFGHTPVDIYRDVRDTGLIPIAGNQLTLLDTAAALLPYGRLTAFCIETGKYIQTDRGGAVIEPERVSEQT